jgi:hypothetical protein
MASRLLALGALVGIAVAAAGCRTPEERSRAAHAKFDPKVRDVITRADAALKKDVPPYRAIVDEQNKWAVYLERWAQKYKDPSFNPTIALLYKRNAEIYDTLEESANAEKYRTRAAQYESEGGTKVVVDAGPAPAVAAGVSQGPPPDPEAEPLPPAAPEVRARIAVLPLDEPEATKKSYGYGEQYAGFLNMAFDRQGRFELVERSAIRQLIAERNFAETQIEGDAAKDLGKLLQVDILVVGHVGPNPDHSVFNVTTRLVSTATGKSVASAADTIRDGSGGFGTSSKKMAQELAGLFEQRRQ